MFEELRRRVLDANLLLPKYGLVTLTWGNVSEIDREKGAAAIKPSGVSYDTLRLEDIVVVSLSGEPLSGALRPSSDLATHLVLYRRFPAICGIVHTHSRYAAAFAQAERSIPCYGTTHADYFYGEVPCTRQLTPEELSRDYEQNTGVVIADMFLVRGIDPMAVPAAIVSKHGPFAWGRNASDAVENALVLEEVARMAFLTEQLAPNVSVAPQELLDKHYFRKHGASAYYGQR